MQFRRLSYGPFPFLLTVALTDILTFIDRLSLRRFEATAASQAGEQCLCWLQMVPGQSANSEEVRSLFSRTTTTLQLPLLIWNASS
jgi:hypothetical protein